MSARLWSILMATASLIFSVAPKMADSICCKIHVSRNACGNATYSHAPSSQTVP